MTSDNNVQFTAKADGVEIAVSYVRARFAGHDHFEFSDPSGKGRPIPISRTGYRSHFVHGSFVDEMGGPEEFAAAYCHAVLNGKTLQDDSDEEGSAEPALQPSLFD